MKRLREADNHDDFVFVFLIRLRDDKAKISNFWEEVVPQYHEAQFRRTFRVPRSAFDHVLQNIRMDISSNFPAGRPPVPADKKLAIFLKYVGSRQTLFDLAQTFGVQEYTVLKARKSVTEAIVTNLRYNIHWPDGAQLPVVADSFLQMADRHFPGIVGVIDGSHIPISTPLVSPDNYYNRKKFHSVVLQGVTDNTGSFTDVCVGAPGRMHDARVFRNSLLFNQGMQWTQNGQYHIIGDAAYPLMEWLVTPFRNVGNLSNQQILFNTTLSRRRQVVERAFGMLKQRFRRLKLGIEMRDISEINNLILACCILHNICIHDDTDFHDDPTDLDEDDPRLHPVPNNVMPRDNYDNGRAKRDALMQFL